MKQIIVKVKKKVYKLCLIINLDNLKCITHLLLGV